MREVMKNELDSLLETNLIRPSQSDFASPVVLVKKKDGSIHYCYDFRQVNAVTRKDGYPLQRVTEMIDTLAEARIFTTIDLKSGYHQIEMYPDDIPKTAFITQFGLYEWKVLHFGVCNGPATFQRLMNLLMSGLTWKTIKVYLDEVIVFGRDYDEHYNRLEEVLRRLQKAHLKLSLKVSHDKMMNSIFRPYH